MNYLTFSRKEWEQITGSDESMNFICRIFNKEEGYIEHEVAKDDAEIRVFVDQENCTMDVSSHAFVPSLPKGSGIYQNPDGWGELNEWRINGKLYHETFDLIKGQA